MEVKEDTHREALKKRLLPPKESTTSMVLNGIGNGMMVGFAPFMVMQMYADIVGNHTLPQRYAKASVAATLAGVVFGAWYGYKEASRLEEYRYTLRKEVVELNNRLADHEADTGWVDRMNREKTSQDMQPEAPARG